MCSSCLSGILHRQIATMIRKSISCSTLPPAGVDNGPISLRTSEDANSLSSESTSVTLQANGRESLFSAKFYSRTANRMPDRAFTNSGRTSPRSEWVRTSSCDMRRITDTFKGLPSRGEGRRGGATVLVGRFCRGHKLRTLTDRLRRILRSHAILDSVAAHEKDRPFTRFDPADVLTTPADRVRKRTHCGFVDVVLLARHSASTWM